MIDSKRQRQLCEEHGATFTAAPSHLKVGVALQTLHLQPLNGLRHAPEGDTTGWYLYGGEDEIPQDDEQFFQPLHVAHLEERCPQALPFLGLPPGYRFLLSGDTIDVWFDPQVLKDAA